jgi:hypothetical protein
MLATTFVNNTITVDASKFEVTREWLANANGGKEFYHLRHCSIDEPSWVKFYLDDAPQSLIEKLNAKFNAPAVVPSVETASYQVIHYCVNHFPVDPSMYTAPVVENPTTKEMVDELTSLIDGMSIDDRQSIIDRFGITLPASFSFDDVAAIIAHALVAGMTGSFDDLVNSL